MLTVAQVAAICGVSPITVRSWIRRGHLTRTPRGIDGAEVIRWSAQRSTPQNPARGTAGRYTTNRSISDQSAQ